MNSNDIKKSIMDQFIWDGRIIDDKINIDVKDGTVTLNGEVPTYSSRLAAEEDALSVFGVTRVKNNLKVKYPKPDSIPDEQIKSSIEDMLKLDHRIDTKEIKVEVNNGEVSFSGSVDAYWKKDVTVEYAYRMIGVVDVVDDLEVKPHSNITDQAIAGDIKDALRRNGFYGTDEIKVEVNNGEVNLSGTVSTYRERMKVREIAFYTTGVRNVVDEIKIREKLAVS